MDANIRTAEALAATVGKLAGARDAKVIDHLDDGAQRWLAASALMFASLAGDDDVAVTLAGGTAGFARAGGPRQLILPGSAVDDGSRLIEGQGFGSLFVVPGLSETLRVNGRIERIGDAFIEVGVDECYMHCAKALIRSRFWEGEAPGAGKASRDSKAPAVEEIDPGAVLAQARFLALATADDQGHADLSPKGDPAGLLLIPTDDGLMFADRPGNRRTDSFLNMLTRPRVALAALVPGSAQLAIIRGRAALLTDASLRARLAVDGKTPALVVRLTEVDIELRTSQALQRAALWPAAAAPAGLDPAALFAGHVRASRSRGVGMLVARAMVSVPGLMRKGLENDYRKNLY